jgi:hypothetical protein
MSLLERRYRHWLRLLPASYRAEREEEMVSAFLEGSPGVSDEHGPRPRWSEIASVAVLAVRVRLGGGGDAAPRFLAWGETVRLVALLGLGLQAFLGALATVTTLRAYGMIGEAAPLLAQAAGPPGSPERLANILGGLAGLLWFVPLAALLLGRPRAARASALLALVPVLVQAFPGVFPQSAPVGLLMPLVTVSALWAGFHRDARPARRSPWLLAVPLAAGVAVATLYEVIASPAATVAWTWPWLDEPGLRSVFVLGAGVAYARVHVYAPARRTPSWPLALAILALPVLCARLAVLNHAFGLADEVSRIITIGMLGQAVLLLALVAGSTVLGLRTLPAAPARSRGGPVEG